MVMMFCSDCDAWLGINDTACPKCGSKNRTVIVLEQTKFDEINLHLKELPEDLEFGKGHKHKASYEVHIKKDFHQKTQQDAVVRRTFYRLGKQSSEGKTYIEEIRDMEGWLIHYAEDDLLKHHNNKQI